MEFTAKNTGKSVKINPASFKEAIALKKEVLKCLKNAGIIEDINIDKLKNLNVADLFTSLSNLIITMDTSNGFENALFDCLKVCIYDGKYAITSQLFDDKPELQEDYYEIVSKCCEVNLRPFFKSLYSELSTRINAMDLESQELPLQQSQNS